MWQKKEEFSDFSTSYPFRRLKTVGAFLF